MGLLAIPFLAVVGLTGHAWSENIGWVSFSGPRYQVTIDEATGAYGGWAWSEHVGWLKFAGDGARACAVTEGGDCGGGLSGNNGDWNGVIKLKGPGYGVSIQGAPETGCYLAGYAWSPRVIGWLKMQGGNYGVRLERCIMPPEPPHEYDLSCTFNAAPRLLIPPQRTARLSWQCADADACRINGVGAVHAGSGARIVAPAGTTTYTLTCSNAAGQATSLSQTVQVIKGTLCEINPADPGCE
jgi:hypothetical protein